MFDKINWKSMHDSIEAEYHEQEARLENALSKIQLLEKELAALKNIQNCSTVIDFDKLNVFSIERVLDKDGTPNTCIGYFYQGGIHEWFLYCSNDAHERLVKEFVLTIGK